MMSLHLTRKRRYVYGRIAAITAVDATLAFLRYRRSPEAKHKLGAIDPHVNSWLSMQHSLEQFLHPEFMLRLSGASAEDRKVMQKALADAHD